MLDEQEKANKNRVQTDTKQYRLKQINSKGVKKSKPLFQSTINAANADELC